MKLQNFGIKVFLLLLIHVYLAENCWTQIDSSRNYRIMLRTYSFDPLDSINQPELPVNLIKQPKPDEPSYQIIQFKRSLTRKQIEFLKSEYGLKLNTYLSNYAYLEKLSQGKIDSIKQLEYFRWNGYYQPAYKIDPLIGKRNFITEERIAVEFFILIVTLHSDAEINAIAGLIQAEGIEVLNSFDDSEIGGRKRLRVKVTTEEQIETIALIEDVECIEEEGEITEDNATTSAVIQSNNPANTPIYNHGIHGEGQILGIIDASVDTNHCFFNDATNIIGPSHRKIVGFRQDATVAFNNPANCGATNATPVTPAIPSGHGTHTAGTLAGFTAGGINNGVAFNARITFGYNVDLTWIGGTRTFMEYLNAAKNDGADIHSNSWSDKSTTSYTILCEDLDRFTWNNEDALVVVSSSNNIDTDTPPDGINDVPSPVHPPWTSKNGLSVGAAQQFPNQNNQSTGGIGPTDDGRRKPDIYAPGEGIISSRAGTNCNTLNCTGSSMATPAIAGAAALVRQYYMEGWYPSGSKQPHNSFTPSGALLKATLLNSTRNMNGTDNWGNAATLNGYPTDLEGWGLLVLDDALYFAGDIRNLWVWDVRHSNGLATGESNNYTVEVVNNGQPLKITLVWTEPPTSSGSATPVINNLNLVVIDPNNNTFLGNQFVNGQSATGGSADDLNNVEMVLINNPVVGEYTIQINAAEVNQGKTGQGYAVVVTADTPEPPVPIGAQNTLVVRTGVPGISGDVAPPHTTVLNIMNNVINYIDKTSYGEVTIVTEYREVNLTQSSTFYYSSSNNVLIEMAEDVIAALLAADPNTFDKGTVATNDDIDRMMIVLNDQNFTDDYATTGPWPYDLPGGITRRISVSVNSIYNDPEERFGHSLGHHFGLVDLYAHPNVTFAQPHVDDWDNMAFPLNGSDFMAWSKERATWISEHGSNIIYIPRPGAGDSYDQTHGIHYISSTGLDNKAIAIGMTENATTLEDEDVFYFIEAREKTTTGDPDDNVPMTGVLLYYVNENIPQGEGPVRIIDKTPGTPLAQDAAYLIGDSKTVDGRGLKMTVNAGTSSADYDIRIEYDPPETDNDVNIRKGDPAYTSPDIWIDSQKDGFDEDMGRIPQDRGDAPVTGEVNRVYVRVFNPGPGDAYDFTIYVRMSEPYHTVGGAADFNKAVGEIYIPKLESANSPFIGYVEWIPDEDNDPHSCARVSIPDVFSDVNELNNTAQQNLREVASSHSSPYDEVTYNFGFSNPEDSKELFYFRVDGVPDNWIIQLSPEKAYLDANERIECFLKIKPPDNALVCTEHKISVTSWMARGHTLIPVGGGAVQTDLRNRTTLTLTNKLTDCTKENMVAYTEKQACMVIESKGCTNPPRPFEEIIVRYEHPDGYPIYRTVVTDEFGCYYDELVVAEGGQWVTSAEYPGNDCYGPAFVDYEITVNLPQTHDQDGDGLKDKDEPQGDHDQDGLIGIYDPDSDNDGIRDGNEMPGDCDRDGLNNVIDPDSDNDGIIDGIDGSPYSICQVLPKKYSLSAHLGITIPTGSFGNNYNSGFNVMVDLDYHFSQKWSIVVLFGYNKFNATTIGIDDTYWINVSGNLRYFLPINPPLNLYFGCGPGLYIPEAGSSEFGANAGVGLDYNYNRYLTFELGVNYHTIFKPGIQFTNPQIGIIFKF